MRWAAHISLLLAIAVALASSSAPALGRTRTQTGDRKAVASSRTTQPRAAHKRTTDRKARPAVPAIPPASKKRTYTDGYSDGYAAGRAAALRDSATNARCAPSSAPRRSNAKAAQTPDSPPDETASKNDSASLSAPTVIPLPRKGGPMPPPLRGSTESLTRQNERLEAEGLERIEDERDLAGRIAHRLLVPVPTSGALSINQDLPTNRRYCRPWTARFLADLAHAHQAAFRRPIVVSSAVRTVAYQKRLMTTNGNAAQAEGDIVSPHLTGASVDIPKSGFSSQEIAWMRRYLAALQQAGKIDVEEEFQQACFHITVYKTYLPQRSGTKSAPLRTSTPRPAIAKPVPATVRPVSLPGAKPRAATPLRSTQAEQQPFEVVVDGN